jgi:hypothetical protein
VGFGAAVAGFQIGRQPQPARREDAEFMHGVKVGGLKFFFQPQGVKKVNGRGGNAVAAGFVAGELLPIQQ